MDNMFSLFSTAWHRIQYQCIFFIVFQFFVSSIWHKQTYQPINTPFVDNLEGSNLANWCNACCTDVMQVNCSLIAHRSKLCTRHTDVLY